MLNAKVMHDSSFASASRSAYHCSVVLLSLSSRAENNGENGVLGRLPGGRGRGRLIRRTQLRRRQVVGETLPVVEILLRDALVPHDVADVGVAEDAAG